MSTLRTRLDATWRGAVDIPVIERRSASLRNLLHCHHKVCIIARFVESVVKV
jgi:organic hydroperoxide reductase OsmC/OhrA